MIQQKEGSPDCPPASGLDNWSIEDLASSGLTPDDFSIEPLKTEVELEEHLGFTALADHNGNLIKIIDIGGYWIPYTNVPGYYRLKLKEKIGDAKYLSAQKEKALSETPPPQVGASLKMP